VSIVPPTVYLRNARRVIMILILHSAGLQWCMAA
jgi:hypothetical protein